MMTSDEKHTLFLISPSEKPCGVEGFARDVAARWPGLGLRARTLPISGRIGDWRAVWRGLDDAEALAVNLPLVAWKKVLATPLVALILALIRGRTTIVVLHEWSDLDWRRRAIVGAYALLARRLVFSSPWVRAGFLASPLIARLTTRHRSIAPIPSNIAPAAPSGPSPFAARIREAREDGKIVIGHFGSIYPKKRSDFVLEVAAECARAGRPALCLFVGSFIEGSDRVEEEFRAKARRLGLEDDILVSDFVEDAGTIQALFRETDGFVYSFSEGLTSRRGSVLACLQSDRLVVVNAPLDAREFDHHHAYRRALADGSLRLVANDAPAAAYAELLLRASSERREPARLYEQSWRDAAAAIAACLDARADARGTPSPAAIP